MANANARRLTSLEAAPCASSDQKLEQIIALVGDPARITPAMLRIKIRAIYEGIEVPETQQAFLALAVRAGVRHRARYESWAQMCIGRPGIVLRDATVVAFPAEVIEQIEDAGAAEEAGNPVNAETALYRWWDEADLLLYIGISDRLRNRTGSHVEGSSWMDFAARSAIERHPVRSVALDAERRAIETEHPLFNVQYNDTPEARKRLVEYLIKRDRLDLLTPAVSRG
jgi:hypothetical protein